MINSCFRTSLLGGWIHVGSTNLARRAKTWNFFPFLFQKYWLHIGEITIGHMRNYLLVVVEPFTLSLTLSFPSTQVLSFRWGCETQNAAFERRFLVGFNGFLGLSPRSADFSHHLGDHAAQVDEVSPPPPVPPNCPSGGPSQGASPVQAPLPSLPRIIITIRFLPMPNRSVLKPWWALARGGRGGVRAILPSRSPLSRAFAPLPASLETANIFANGFANRKSRRKVEFCEIFLRTSKQSISTRIYHCVKRL